MRHRFGRRFHRAAARPIAGGLTNHGLLFVVAALVSATAIYARGQEALPLKKSATEHLVEARQFGWLAVASIIDNLGKSDPKKFPGLRAFSEDYAKATRGLDPSRPPEEWPAVDVDALITRNPNFWRANYEVRPGDPAWMYTHAGLLLGGGEATRAQQILALARQSRGTPKQMHDALDQMLSVAESVIRDANEAVGGGIKLYDKGDKDGAIGRYRDALKVWPQNSFAHYELGLSLHARAVEARGEEVPKLGTIQVGPRFPKIPEVEECFARARRHDPLRLEAYQGAGPEVLPRLVALQECLKAWAVIVASPAMRAPEGALLETSEGCQLAGAHELALVVRQVVVGRRGGLGRSDHIFITTSLRALAPGPQSEATLKYLDNPRIEMRSLTDVEPENTQP
ncbi:tetratricopeptide repeat protein [Singulisphaera acidiphila]|uniref:Tetratricopeptide repeat protein n=1 Tax=Singulisphaera acidiphila (strain ATCC BAA-1392 / DSM 18658 / VKM B-2454 / MOB10) TaxID=886293 RepID=L0DHU8_SINAD|nr:hypothetical protein [Singulisphaera acidiphila]AGA28949.1 hypothetical protein Sinac_4785 [Singulisphaera acidiphila DSM 18658]